MHVFLPYQNYNIHISFVISLFCIKYHNKEFTISMSGYSIKTEVEYLKTVPKSDYTIKEQG